MANREVAESSFELFYGEIVRSILSRNKVLEINPKYADEMQQASVKLEALGFDVGYRYVERCTKDRTRLVDTLDIIKFLCKDLWLDIFHKQVDKLQTNHKGVFVLQDFNLRWLRYLSSHDEEDTNLQATPYLVFPCGLIRGALANLGVEATVNATVGIPNHPNNLSCT